MPAALEGFDWDDGNWPKCQKHGLTKREIEELFTRPVLIVPDEGHSQHEQRLNAIGQTTGGRSVFIAFTVRASGGRRLIRPISARYMHREEVETYEAKNPQLRDG